MKNTQNGHPYDQLTETDKRFLNGIVYRFANEGKEVTPQKLAGVMVRAREELKEEECQNSSGKLHRGLHNLCNQNSVDAARRLEMRMRRILADGD